MSDKPTAEVWVVWFQTMDGWTAWIEKSLVQAQIERAKLERDGLEVRLDRLVSTLPEKEEGK